MFNSSPTANINYLAEIITLDKLEKHPNADRLQIATIYSQPIITGLDAKVGDKYVYFPVESAINKEFLSDTNSFSKSALNKDTSVKGFFSASGRVKATKLRGEYSMGYIIPIHVLEEFVGKLDLTKYSGPFDTVKDTLLLSKYAPKTTVQNPQTKQGRSPKFSRLVPNQVRLHVDTINLRKNMYMVRPDDMISVTYKTHGTSFWVGNLLVKDKPSLLAKVVNFFQKVKSTPVYYDILYGSRNVVKNKYILTKAEQNTNSFYDTDVYGDVKDQVKDLLPAGITIYGEILGYTPSGSFIQKPYDYKCKVGDSRFEIYRITSTNFNGDVIEFTYPQIVEFCNIRGLTPSYLEYYGTFAGLLAELKVSSEDDILTALEAKYTNKPCFMCETDLPAEGIVIRRESLIGCNSYKLKSLDFLHRETKQLDQLDLE